MFKYLVPSVLIAIFALVFTVQPAHAQSDDQNITAAGQSNLFLPIVNHDSSALCRFGVNKDIEGYNTTPLRVGWYLNYIAYPSSEMRPAGASYLPVIRLTQTGPETYRLSLRPKWAPATVAELKKAIAARPGAEWFIGNEPDRRDRLIGHQDDIEPQVYAIAYHDLYELIKQEDPTATVIAGSIVQPTSVRLKYLNKVLIEYRQRYGTPMPVDVWATHNFILNEVSCDAFPDLSLCWGADIPPGIDDDKGMVISTAQNDDIEIFKAQIQRLREWLADKGYAGTPIYVSEYGVLFGPENGWPEYDALRVSRFMNATFDYMLNTTDPVFGDPTDGHRLVQRFSWYSIYDAGYNGSLYTDKGALSAIGANYAAYAAGIEGNTDFYPVEFVVDGAAASGTERAAAVNLTARIANSGNVGAAHAAIVRFYDGNPAGKGVQVGEDQFVHLAGCGQDAEVSAQWDNPKPGQHNLFVVVEPQRMGRESNDANNTMKITVTIGTSAAAPSVFHAIAHRAYAVTVRSLL